MATKTRTRRTKGAEAAPAPTPAGPEPILADAHDPAGELSEVADGLGDLLGLARHAAPAVLRDSTA